MSDTDIITIDLNDRSYDIFIGAGLIYRLKDFVPQSMSGRKVFVLHDENVTEYAGQVENILGDAGASSVASYALPAGEATKSFKHVEKICSWLVQNGANRESYIFAVGGGVTGDLAGFCASIILRGVPYIHIPTTLLAQVDSSVGGKTGINIPEGKNLVGSFYQPAAVIIDIDTLKTLPMRQILAGYAEIVKYGLINDSGFFNWLEENGGDVCALEAGALRHAIRHSVEAKAEIVQADEREQGQRALLNLGHTFGHGLEAAAGYDGRLLHGEAVAIGMVMAFDLSVRLQKCDAEELERVERHLTEVGLPTRASFIDPPILSGANHLMEHMRADKKANSEGMRFILVNAIGQAHMSGNIDEKLVIDVLVDSLGDETAEGKKGEWKSAFTSHS